MRSVPVAIDDLSGGPLTGKCPPGSYRINVGASSADPAIVSTVVAIG
jgi:hypothetical protein